jgi:hypothetical protein
VSQFLLNLPGGVPARVTISGGASYVSVDNQNLTGARADGDNAARLGKGQVPVRHRRHRRVFVNPKWISECYSQPPGSRT